eukprot:TRINITY_DN32984_c0_g1_i1.p2 TRINITY_DN32984_c0_g1~~TRINITY_DN32984_c0_g1_i1.p2  ORF type:complete len:261 (-),score=27.32 TRINITY_DN32984_c0_g1_i1:186-968(-)
MGARGDSRRPVRADSRRRGDDRRDVRRSPVPVRRESPPPRRRTPPRRSRTPPRRSPVRRPDSRRRPSPPPPRRSPPRRSPPRKSPPRRRDSPPPRRESPVRRRESPPPRRRDSPPPRRSPPRRQSPPPRRSRSRGQPDNGRGAARRSRSKSPLTESLAAPRKTAVSLGETGFEDVEGKVADARARNDGSQQWQAELIFTLASQSSLGSSGRARSMTIRGPYRTDKDKVQDDVDKLLDCSKNSGMKAVRDLANQLKKGRIA